MEPNSSSTQKMFYHAILGNKKYKTQVKNQVREEYKSLYEAFLII